MCTLEKFDKLCVAPIPKKQIALQTVDKHGKLSASWVASLPNFEKHEQYRQVKVVLGELIIADIAEEGRLSILESLVGVVERLSAQMQAEYINNPQNSFAEQKIYVDEVRSLYFLTILAYQSVAFVMHKRLEGQPTGNQKAGGGWFKKMTGLSANVGGIASNDKQYYALAVYRIMTFCSKLLAEFALTYQKSPSSLWRVMNGWYLKSALLGVDQLDIGKINPNIIGNIHKQYLYSCLLSFANLFAYRRPDILNICRLLPEWAEYVQTTFNAESHFRVFVNLQSDTPPELITPFASINPYSHNHVCLFLDVSKLFAYLKSLEKEELIGLDGKRVFESRLAKMVLLAFHRQVEQPTIKALGQSAYMMAGFGEIYQEMSHGRNFAQVIAQSQLPSDYHPKRVFGSHHDFQKEQVKLISRSDSGARFLVGSMGESEDGEQMLTRPYLPVFGLFAMMSPRSKNKHPWRLGIVHWAEPKEDHVEVDGRFLGRILSVCGVRLNTKDMRSRDFVQAMLLAGDELNQQTTLILPRYHFKERDMVVLRIDDKETLLRLEENLLSTDDIEQYQIVRLAS